MQKSLYEHESSNIWKTWLLMLLFFVLIIGFGWYFSFLYSNPVILYGAVLFSVVMNVVSYWYSDRVVIALSGAKEAKREEYFDLYNTVENLSITAGLPMPKVYVIDDPAPNAFATGRNKEHAVVAATTGLLDILNRSELEGVIAHELSHIGNRDMLVSTVAVVLVGLVSLISDFFLRASFYRRSDRDGGGGGIFVVIGILFAILAPLVATLLRLAISRKREFLADASGALLTRYPDGLASALEKIGGYSRPLKHASDVTAHLYISNPFGPRALKGIHKLFLTHPPIEERIQVLRNTQ